MALGRYYVLGLLFRYCILFPFRLGLLLGASALFFAALPIVLHSGNEQWQRWLFKTYAKAYLASWGSRIRYHGTKPELKEPHVFVSNHTSFIDYVILSAHVYPHATISQKHGGIIGYFQRSILSLNGSLMFNRNQKDDRTWLAKK
jgi:1-acyl-sn-glycerol-3-phosphate acyltransferase